MTFWKTWAIWLTSVQLSAISVPPSSAVKPPKDGTTSPPLARMVLISLPNVVDAIGMPLSPFQNAVHEPTWAVCRNAMVRYLAPDCWDSVAGFSPVQDSKYGAKTWVGSGVPAALAG